MIVDAQFFKLKDKRIPPSDTKFLRYARGKLSCKTVVDAIVALISHLEHVLAAGAEKMKEVTVGAELDDEAQRL